MALSHGIGLLALSHSLTSAAVIGSATCHISVDDYLLGFWVDGVDYFGQPTPIGCYADSPNRAMPTRLADINLYSGYQRCAYNAKAYDYFAVQNGHACFATDDLDAAMQYGSSNACNKGPDGMHGGHMTSYIWQNKGPDAMLIEGTPGQSMSVTFPLTDDHPTTTLALSTSDVNNAYEGFRMSCSSDDDSSWEGLATDDRNWVAHGSDAVNVIPFADWFAHNVSTTSLEATFSTPMAGTSSLTRSSNGGSSYCPDLNYCVDGSESIWPNNKKNFAFFRHEFKNCYFIEGITGGWRYSHTNYADTYEYTQSVGTTHHYEDTRSESQTKTWSRSVTNKISGGFKVFGVGASASRSVTVTSSTAQTIASTHSEAFGTTTLEEHKFTFNSKGVIWNWVYDTMDGCGSSSTQTPTIVMTPSSTEPPCCPPGFEKDINIPHGPCAVGYEALNLCNEFSGNQPSGTPAPALPGAPTLAPTDAPVPLKSIASNESDSGGSGSSSNSNSSPALGVNTATIGGAAIVGVVLVMIFVCMCILCRRKKASTQQNKPPVASWVPPDPFYALSTNA